MGSFNEVCALSGLNIHCGTPDNRVLTSHDELSFVN